jgi:hypothetical protein
MAPCAKALLVNTDSEQVENSISVRTRVTRRSLLAGTMASGIHAAYASEPDINQVTGRRPKSDSELKYWLQNAIWYHRYSDEEAAAALAMTPAEVRAACDKHKISTETRPSRADDGPLLVLPYPGGRHPRIGFLDGAIDPQRETKISVFTPWDPASYVVVDLPEAIWSDLGLTYLAHTHVPTIWSKQGIELPHLEWERHGGGRLSSKRTLPNGIAFGAEVRPGKDGVRMQLWLKNGTKEPLSDLRIQNCVMLKGASGFTDQTNDNKAFASPYVAAKSRTGDRWIITAWTECFRPWANPPCPCIHSDPKVPDTAPGEERRLHGWLSFYEGTDLEAELKRLDSVNWRGR